MVKHKPLEELISELSDTEKKKLRDSLTQTKLKKVKFNHAFPKDNIRFGYMSDTHIGHKCFSRELFDLAMVTFQREGIEHVYHPGDVLEGMSGRDGHIYELDKIGFNAQIDLAEQLFGQYPNIQIHAIDGNHDGWFYQRNNGGMIVGVELEKRLSNYHFLGQMEADVLLNNVIRMKLFHANDGSAYASCFDDKTEILTEEGWKLFKNLKKERVATLNLKNDEFQWQEPTAKTIYPFKGKMLHFKARCIDLMVTPNHRMLIRRYATNLLPHRKTNLKFPAKSHGKVSFDWIVKPAEELKDCKRQEWQMKRNCNNWTGLLNSQIEIPYRESKNRGVKVHHWGKQSIENIAELIAWYVTEGSIRKSQLQITQYKKVNPENFYNIVDLFRRMGIEPKQSRGRDIMVGSLELCEWLIKECSSGSRNKYLPKWLKEQPTDILKIVFETMVAGDGWNNSTTFGYKSISKRLLQDFEEVAIKLGYAVTENKDCVSVSQIQTEPTINEKPNEVEYNGNVYCVSVPNSFILVRRNGKAIWSGNSYKLQKLIESFTGGEKPHIVLSGHYHKHLTLWTRNVFGVECGTLESQTAFMRGKKLAAHMGFGIINMGYDENGIKRLDHTFIPHFESGDRK